MQPVGFRPEYCFDCEHPKPDLKPPSDSIRDPDRLFNDLYTSADGPAYIARRHNITLAALIAFATSQETRAKLDALRQIAHDRADMIAAEARISAALSLQRCTIDEPCTESARLAASVIFRASSPSRREGPGRDQHPQPHLKVPHALDPKPARTHSLPGGVIRFPVPDHAPPSPSNPPAPPATPAKTTAANHHGSRSPSPHPPPIAPAPPSAFMMTRSPEHHEKQTPAGPPPSRPNIANHCDPGTTAASLRTHAAPRAHPPSS